MIFSLESPAGREHDHRNEFGAGVIAQITKDGETIHLRQHQIEEDDVGSSLSGNPQCREAIHRLEQFVVLLPHEGDLYQFSDIFFIINDKDGGHGLVRQGLGNSLNLLIVRPLCLMKSELL